MKQMDLIDWLDEKRVIRQLPPTQSTQHRLFIIKQLKSPSCENLKPWSCQPSQFPKQWHIIKISTKKKHSKRF
ncbi:hypothetical protein [Bathymodiolus platifrons methanotrophic gill symbiont]|uniref:hypothetical protein n=1 Tax=Bathymodiolus platifrons methanotrophic gill symbiont TaxID=113268 RepID=UPI001124FB08|nr:hypothetical protein [Bathymodiolus platifrons methanotrophic gill symbiont]